MSRVQTARRGRNLDLIIIGLTSNLELQLHFLFHLRSKFRGKSKSWWTCLGRPMKAEVGTSSPEYWAVHAWSSRRDVGCMAGILYMISYIIVSTHRSVIRILHDSRLLVSSSYFSQATVDAIRTSKGHCRVSVVCTSQGIKSNPASKIFREDCSSYVVQWWVHMIM